jgi:hypothetical protein
MLKTLVDFAVIDNPLVALAYGGGKTQSVNTALPNKTVEMPSTTGLIEEAIKLARELIAFKPWSWR